jgi:hypothetical protein
MAGYSEIRNNIPIPSVKRYGGMQLWYVLFLCRVAHRFRETGHYAYYETNEVFATIKF